MPVFRARAVGYRFLQILQGKASLPTPATAATSIIAAAGTAAAAVICAGRPKNMTAVIRRRPAAGRAVPRRRIANTLLFGRCSAARSRATELTGIVICRRGFRFGTATGDTVECTFKPVTHSISFTLDRLSGCWVSVVTKGSSRPQFNASGIHAPRPNLFKKGNK